MKNNSNLLDVLENHADSRLHIAGNLNRAVRFERTNGQRAEAAAQLARVYAKNNKTDGENALETLQDIVTDLLHLAHGNKQNPADLLTCSIRRFLEEAL